jgi:phosphomevalonate kinase
MSHQPLTYYEKLENVYVLMETQQMLQNKLKQSKESNESTHLIEEDLRKIEEEIKEYTEEAPTNQTQLITSSLFNPGLLEED